MKTGQYTVKDVQDAITLAWQIGRLNYRMRNTQRTIKNAWIESKTRSRKFYIEATRRLGKSSLLLTLFAEECRSTPNRKCGFFAPVKDGLLDYIEPLIAKTFEDCPESLRPQFDKTRFLLRFNNGSMIIFRGSNNQQHRVRRGQEFHLAGIDEARDVDDLQSLTESVVFPALFSTEGYLIISSTPADTRSHPLFEYRQQAQVGGWFVQITMEDAHALDPDVYTRKQIDEWKSETIKALDGQDIWEREYECKWVVNRRRQAVPEWDSSKMVLVPGPDAYARFYHRYIGLDWGYRDYTGVVFATLNFRKARLEFNGELTFSGRDVRSDLVSDRITTQMNHLWEEDFKKRDDFAQRGIHCYRQVSDSADPILINELNKFKNMNFVPVEKAHTLEAMLNEFRVLVSAGKIAIDPKCQMLIHCLENGIWTDDRKKLDKDNFAHHFDHLMAAVYLTRMVDWNANPIPRDFMIDNVRVIEINFDKSKTQGESARSLESAFVKKR